MAAATYGAVLSLKHLLDNLQHPSRQHLHYDRSQIQTLCQNASFLFDFLEDYSQILCHEDTIDLARQIFHAVDEAEEIIDYHVVDQLSQQSSYDVDKGLLSFREGVVKGLNKMESIKKELMMVTDRERAVKDQQPRVHVPSAGSSAPPSSAGKNNMVGFEDRLVHVMDQLTGDEQNLQIVPITGIGGIGKTTLAQNVFNSRRIVNHFDLRKWITRSESFSIQQVLLGLLGEQSNGNNEESKEKLAELGGNLYKSLFDRKYLIVMDDVWSTEVWDKLGLFFPNNKNGSRILVTSWSTNVAVSLSPEKPYVMDFMDKETSWKLFCTKAFGNEICQNPKLEEIGKNIFECCKGLPLAVATIGGLLGKSNMAQNDWELVAKDVLKSIDNCKDEHGDCSSILYLSYKHLPIHLKPCFLYLSVFDEDEEIGTNKLIDYWVAEGLVKPKDYKTLEEVAGEYLKDLTDRNLIALSFIFPLISEFSKCKVHDLLRDLCVREHEKEFCFSPSKIAKFGYGSDGTCSLCGYRKASTWIDLPQVSSTITPLQTKLVSCFVCGVCNVMCSNHNRLRVVKVAHDAVDNSKYLKPTRLRYLKVHQYLESTVLSIFWNLQYLKLGNSKIEVPAGIREMAQLRHLKFGGVKYVDSQSTQTDKEDDFILENIESLTLVLDEGGAEFLKRIPNVTFLHIEHSEYSDELALLNQTLHHVADLHKLRFLRCKNVDLEYISFPKSLKILSLQDCNCPWERKTIIGSLPNLEVLVLVDTLEGPEWNPIEEEFRRLKILGIGGNDLERWNVEKEHFPRLEILALEGTKCLEKIPSEIGDIGTLREIRLSRCSESLQQSAEEIIE